MNSRIEIDLVEIVAAAIIRAGELQPDIFRPKVVHTSSSEDSFLDSKEASAFLKISKKKLYALNQAGIIQGYRSGRKFLFSRQELVSSVKLKHGRR